MLFKSPFIFLKMQLRSFPASPTIDGRSHLLSIKYKLLNQYLQYGIYLYVQLDIIIVTLKTTISRVSTPLNTTQNLKQCLLGVCVGSPLYCESTSY